MIRASGRRGGREECTATTRGKTDENVKSLRCARARVMYEHTARGVRVKIVFRRFAAHRDARAERFVVIVVVIIIIITI